MKEYIKKIKGKVVDFYNSNPTGALILAGFGILVIMTIVCSVI